MRALKSCIAVSLVLVVSRCISGDVATAQPADKPVLNNAPLNLNDSVQGTTIRGQVPVDPVIRNDIRNPAQYPSDGIRIRGQEPIGTSIRGTAPVGAAPSVYTLPLEIVLFNINSADCRPKTTIQAEWDASLAILLKIPACIALEKERAALKEQYKDDPRAVDGLTLKIGHGGPFNYAQK